MIIQIRFEVARQFGTLIKLIKEKIYTSPLVAESVSIYYQYFDKKIAARNVIENYLCVSQGKKYWFNASIP